MHRPSRPPCLFSPCLPALLCALFLGSATLAQEAALDLVTLVHQGAERSYYVHVPATLQGRTDNAAILAFHGGEGDGRDVEAASRLAEAADAAGFVAIFPNSPGTQWNDGRAETRSGFDDVDFVRAVIADATGREGVDPARVFAAGISNGGMFVQRLACEATPLFRAYAVVAANMPENLLALCSPSAPAPMIFFNGTDDRLMPFGGGEIRSLRLLGIGVGGSVISHDATLDFWARANGCTVRHDPESLPDRTDDGTTVTRDRIDGCNGGVTLDFLVVAGGGHNWPGMTLRRASRLAGTVSRDIDATQEMIGLFRRYGL